MKRGPLAVVVGIIGLVVGLLIGRVAMAPGGAGGGPPTARTPHDRKTLVVLLPKNGGGCRALKVDEHRAFRNDHVVWDVHDECGADGQTVSVAWTNGNSPTNDDASDVIRQGRARIRITIDKVPSSSDTMEYDYALDLNNNRVTDPKLEIDPF